MLNKVEGSGWIKTMPTDPFKATFDSLGAAIEFLSGRVGLSSGQPEVLLAIAAVSGQQDEWVNLRQVKEKLPLLSAYKLTRILGALSEGNGLLSGFFLSSQQPFVEIRKSTISGREKVVKLTDWGRWCSLRAAQIALDATSANLPNAKPIRLAGKLSVCGRNKSGKRIQVDTRCLLSLGREGILSSSIAIVERSVSQGATVYWIATQPFMLIAGALSSAANSSSRSGSFFVRHFPGELKSSSAEEVIRNHRICFHGLGHQFGIDADKVLSGLVEYFHVIADTVEFETNPLGTVIVLSSHGISRLLESDEFKNSLHRISISGCAIHLIDTHPNEKADEGTLVDLHNLVDLQKMGFAILDYRLDREAVSRDGFATLTTADNRLYPFILMDMPDVLTRRETDG